MKNVGEVTYTGTSENDYNKGMICFVFISDRVTYPPQLYLGCTAVIQDV